MQKIKGLAVGCGVLVLAVVVLGIGATIRVLSPFNHAVSTRSTLEEKFGSPETYTPPPSGVGSPDRIEAFIQVRQAIMVSCQGFTDIADRMRRLEDMDQKHDVSKIEAVSQATSLSRAMLGLGATMGDLYRSRNDALLAANMGLGEYTLLYLTAYQRQVNEPIADEIFMEGSPLTDRVSRGVRGMMSRQLAALRSEGIDPQLASVLERELAALENDPRRLPWADGLPPQLSASFVPFQARLDELFCPAMTKMELMRNTRRGVVVETD